MRRRTKRRLKRRIGRGAPVLVATVAGVALLAAVLGVIASGDDGHEPGRYASAPAAGSPVSSPTVLEPPAAVAALVPGASMWDDFSGPDSTTDLNGSSAPTGHRYSTSHSGGSSWQIRSHRLVPVGVGPESRTAIVYADVEGVQAVGARWQWTPGASGHESVVVGVSAAGFGRGSVQLAVYATPHGRERVGWALFYVPVPLVDPYPVLASGPLPAAATGRVALVRTGPDEVTVRLPDGSSQVVSDPAVAAYWGEQVGWQVRRPGESDGSAEFTLLAAG